jgi:hypothetical protein
MGEMDDGTCGRYRVFLTSVVLVREDYRGQGKWTMGARLLSCISGIRGTRSWGLPRMGEMDDGTRGRYRVFLVSAVLLREDYRGWGNGRWDVRLLSCISGIRGTPS